jgi:MFS family permease
MARGALRQIEPERQAVEAEGKPSFPPGTAPIVAVLMLSMFLVALDGTVVSTAMPSIIGDLGGFKFYAWVPAVYLLSAAVTTPIYGKLADLSIHVRNTLPPVLLRHIHDELFNGIHIAFLAALVAAVAGTAVVSKLPGGSALEHELLEAPGGS